jgi:hypothetical protein
MMPIDVPLKNMVQQDCPASMPAALRVLGGDDYGEILKHATKYAVDRGAKPEPGVELYDFAKAVYTVALAVVDSESDPDHPRPFFGDSDSPSVEERAQSVLSHPNIGRDTIMYLAELQDYWQDECSPQSSDGEKTPEEFFKIIAEVLADGPLALMRKSAGMRLKSWLFMANLLVSSQMPNTTSGSDSVTAG